MSSSLLPAYPGSLPRHAVALGLALLLHLLLYEALLAGGLNWAQRTQARDAPGMRSRLVLVRLAPAPAASQASVAANPTRLPPRRRATRTAGEPEVVETARALAAGAGMVGERAAAPPDFSGAPVLDMQQLRAQARENEKTRVKTVREQIRDGELQDRSLEAKVATAAKRAVRPDCEKAFAGVGLLAVIPLAASLVTDVGCKWR